MTWKYTYTCDSCGKEHEDKKGMLPPLTWYKITYTDTDYDPETLECRPLPTLFCSTDCISKWSQLKTTKEQEIKTNNHHNKTK